MGKRNRRRPVAQRQTGKRQTTQASKRDRKITPGRVLATIAFLVPILSLGIALWNRLDDSDTSRAPPEAKPPPDLPDQWLSIRAKLAREGWAVAASKDEPLREDGRKSTILILRPRRPTCNATLRSNQVRIYDVEGGMLRESFRFEPTARGCSESYAFKVLSVGRYEEDENSPVVIGEFANDDLAVLRVPVVIKWEAGAHKYTIHGLIRSPPDFLSFDFNTGPLRGTDKNWYESSLQVFTERIRLTSTVSAWAASELRFQREGGTHTPLLAGLYRLTAGNAAPVGEPGTGPGDSTPVVYQQAIWVLYSNSRGTLLAGSCRIPGNRALVLSQPGGRGPTEGQRLRQLARQADDVISTCDIDPSVP